MILSDAVLSNSNDLVIIEGSVVIGSTGAVGVKTGRFISSIVRNDVGNYTITLTSVLNKFFAFIPTFVGTTVSGVMNVQVDSETLGSTGAIIIQCYDASGADVDPAETNVLKFQILARRSSVS